MAPWDGSRTAFVGSMVAREGGGLAGRCMALGPEVACKASDNIPAKRREKQTL